MNEIILRINELMIFFNLNISQMAAKIGVSQPNFSAILSGKRPIGSNMINKFIIAFGVNKEWIESGKGERFIVGSDIETKTIKPLIKEESDNAKRIDSCVQTIGEMLKSDESQQSDNQPLELSEKIIYLEKITSLQDKISNLQDRINNMYEVIIALTAAKGESPDEDTETNRIYSKEIEDFFKEVEERTAKRESRSAGRNAG